VCAYVYVYVYVFMYVYVNVCMYVHVCMCVSGCECVRVDVCGCGWVDVCICFVVQFVEAFASMLVVLVFLLFSSVLLLYSSSLWYVLVIQLKREKKMKTFRYLFPRKLLPHLWQFELCNMREKKRKKKRAWRLNPVQSTPPQAMLAINST